MDKREYEQGSSVTKELSPTTSARSVVQDAKWSRILMGG